MATDSATRRLTKELSDMSKSSDWSIVVTYEERDVRNIRATIIGPPGTPYEFGLFETLLKFPASYPTVPPLARAITTNGNRTRFNPNIYANGKICLSVLGTWPGEAGEGWSGAQGLESVLLSIQSLMSVNPYENEPGHEICKISEEAPRQYAAKIRHETIRISVIQRLESILGIGPATEGSDERPTKRAKNDPAAVPDTALDGNAVLDGDSEDIDTDLDEEANGDDAALLNDNFSKLRRPCLDEDDSAEQLTDFYKRRFLYYYDTYVETVESASKHVRENQQFVLTAFEYPGNRMEGRFIYPRLKKRLLSIRKALDEETDGWVQQGIDAAKYERGSAVKFQRHFEQLTHHYDKAENTTSSFELSLVDKNPLVWLITLYGRYSSDLDGGIIRIQVFWSTHFPEEQPRVRVLTPLFHHRISATGGVLCYFPSHTKHEDVKGHVEAILAAIEDDDPAYDPRTVVNPEASTLLWGNTEQKRLYRRKLRASVAASAEMA